MQTTFESRPRRTAEGRRHCPYCSRTFIKNDHFNRHLRSHTQEKPFGCKICRKFYPRRDTLLRHFKVHKIREEDDIRSYVIDRNNVYGRRSDGSPSADHGLEACDETVAAPLSNLKGIDAGLNPTNLETEEAHTGEDPSSRALHAKVSDTSADREPLRSLDRVFEQTWAVPSTAAASTDMGINTDMLTGPQFSDLDDSAVHFDTTNWLLDENFVDLFDPGNMTWNETRSPNHHPSRPLSPSSSLDNQTRKCPVALDLRHIWYVQARNTIEELHDRSEGRARGQRFTTSGRDIDELYLTNIVEELGKPPRQDPLPSIDFLNLGVQLFFTRCNIALPLVHGPTFRPSLNHVLLVLAMCSAGALTMPGDMAARIGSMIFERALKLGLSYPWERALSEEPHFTRDNLRGSTISQTIALLSAAPAHRAVAAAYHGCLILTARHSKLFAGFPEIDLGEAVSEEQLENAWKRWACYEEMKRAVVILHIHDAELAALFHHEPVFRHNATKLPVPAPAELFQAPNAATWAVKYRAHRQAQEEGLLGRSRSDHDHRGNNQVDHSRLQDQSSPRSMLHSWAALSGIGASICEFRHLDLFSPQRVTEIEADLVRWYRSPGNCCQVEDCRSLEQLEFPFCLRPLWHYTFMTMTSDLDLLEVAVGRDGPGAAALQHDRVRAWVSSRESKRCLLHAWCLQNLVASSALDSAVAMHTPRILFSAALCWYCHILYLPWCSGVDGSGGSQSTDETIEYLIKMPEFRLLRDERRSPTGTSSSRDTFTRLTSDFERVLGQTPAEVKASTLCVLESLLRRLGTSGVAQRFADIIQAFVIGELQ